MSKDNHEAFETFEFDLPPIRGFPELRWAGKRPFKSTQYFPAQKKESYGDPTDGWWNRIYWGDNLQVMSHLMREFRGKVDLVYLDPPFDSKAEYIKTISVHGVSASGTMTAFEEKQYNDIWNDDTFLQFVFERLVLARELLKDTGSIFVHLDWHKSSHVRCIMDEIFSPSNFRNEIIWYYRRYTAKSNVFQKLHDNILWYSKSDNWIFNQQFEPHTDTGGKQDSHYKQDEDGKWFRWQKRRGAEPYKVYLDERGKSVGDVWTLQHINASSSERTGYPTQKPEILLDRIVTSCSNEGDLIFDPFMGSGTAQAVAMKLGRKFIGADINLTAIETAVDRLNELRAVVVSSPQDLFPEDAQNKPVKFFTAFEVYNVNNYDLFRNPVEAKELIREAMELQPLSTGSTFDGQRDGYLVKIMPVNRIATRQDLNEVINGLDYKAFERRQADAPNKPVERIHLVCMGHEPDLGPELVKAAKPFDIEVLVTDLIRDKAHLHFKKSSDARLAIEGGELVIRGFYPMNLLQKLSLEPGAVEDWRQLVESVKVDFNYDGVVLTPAVVDAPGKDELVAGHYAIPADASTIRVKITDLLSESWEGEIENG